MRSKLATIFKTAAFPAVMTVIAFLLFTAVYLYVTLTAVEPCYFSGLLFLIPAVCFGAVTHFTAAGRLKKAVSAGITIACIFVLGIASLFWFLTLSFQAATTTTTDVGKYERVLRLSNYSENTLIRFFPEKIPDGAQDVVFRYHPACLQGGENFELKFRTDPSTVKSTVNKFSSKAKWTGGMGDKEAERNGVFSGTFNELGYDSLPDDFTLYLLDSEPYRPGDWNHGKVGLVAVSRQRNEVVFHAEDW